MLEPPREVPSEVDERLAQIEDASARDRWRLVAVLSLSFLGFIPILAWMGITDLRAVLLYAAVVMINGGFALVLSQRRTRASVTTLHLAVVVNATITVIMARMFTPFLVAPGIAAVSIMMFQPERRIRATFLVPLTVATVLLPWALELAGIWSRTVSAAAGNLVLHSPAVNVTLPATEIALALSVTALIALASFVAKRLGDAQHASLRASELQAWHLRQLMRR